MLSVQNTVWQSVDQSITQNLYIVKKLYVNLRCGIWAWQAFCKKTVIHFGPNWAQKTHIAAITNVKLRTVWARIFMPQCKLPGDSSLLWASVWKFYASAIFAWWHHHAMSSAFTVVKVDTAADTRMACFTELVIFCCFLPVYILWICFWLIPSPPKVSWAWWDWPLTWLTNRCLSVLWHCWLGHTTRKLVSELTYNVSSGTLNPTIVTTPYLTSERQQLSCSDCLEDENYAVLYCVPQLVHTRVQIWV